MEQLGVDGELAAISGEGAPDGAAHPADQVG
jgi:hypothetical protein